jgi:hypothetical protein
VRLPDHRSPRTAGHRVALRAGHHRAPGGPLEQKPLRRRARLWRPVLVVATAASCLGPLVSAPGAAVAQATSATTPPPTTQAPSTTQAGPPLTPPAPVTTTPSGTEPAVGNPVADPAPLATIATDAHQGSSVGIEITRPAKFSTPFFYPARPGAWMQLLVLRRDNLNPITNASYPCPPAHVAGQSAIAVLQCSAKIASMVRQLPDTDLVIAVSPDTGGSANPEGAVGYPQALSSIGVAPPRGWSPAPPYQGGTFAAIGVPGWRPGLATQFAGSQRVANSAAIEGYLIRNNLNLYQFSSNQRLTFNTEAPGSSTIQNVTQVGSQSITTPVSGAGGFLVTVMPEYLLANHELPQATTAYFATGTGNYPTPTQVQTAQAALHSLNAALSSANAQSDLVLVSTRGDAGLHNTNSRYDPEIVSVQNDIAQLGGTVTGAENVFAGRDTYTLAGSSRLGQGRGTEFSAPLSSPEGESRDQATGTMSRDGSNFQLVFSDVQPTTPNASVNGGQLLADTVYKPPGTEPWPGSDNPGESNAITYIGNKVFGTSDPRTQYWTRTYSYETWEGYSKAIGALTPPSTTTPATTGPTTTAPTTTAPGTSAPTTTAPSTSAVPGTTAPATTAPGTTAPATTGPTTTAPSSTVGFTPQDFASAKNELQTEITYVERVNNYLDNLAKPYADAFLTSNAKLQAVANEVADNAQVGTGQQTANTAISIIDFVASVASLAPGVGPAVAGGNAIFHLAMALSEVNGNQDAGASFSTKVAQLGSQMEDRLVATKNTLTQQFADIIVSDYAKLRTVGLCTVPGTTCPAGDYSTWDITKQSDLNHQAQTLQYALESSFYSSVVAAQYKAYVMPPSRNTNLTYFAGRDLLLRDVCFWKPEPKSDQIAVTVSPGVSQISALGYITGDGTVPKPYVMHYLRANVPDKMFGPIDPALDINRGGLGVNKEAFFLATAQRVPAPDYFPLGKSGIQEPPDTGWRSSLYPSEGSCPTG